MRPTPVQPSVYRNISGRFLQSPLLRRVPGPASPVSLQKAVGDTWRKSVDDTPIGRPSLIVHVGSVATTLGLIDDCGKCNLICT